MCRATLAIVDPVLTVGMPPSIIADKGMDAFSHTAEAITSVMANPMLDMLAEKALALVWQYLSRAVKNSSDMEASSNMGFSAMIAGYAFSDAIPHYGHAITHILGAMFYIPHGNAFGTALPEVMEFIAEVVPDEVKRAGMAIGLEIGGCSSPEEIGRMVASAIRELNNKIGLKTLKTYKINESTFPDVAAAALSDDTAGFSPKKAKPEDLPVFSRKAYSL